MVIWGTLISIVTAVILSAFIGPYGLLTLLAVGFGFLFSIHSRIRDVQNDLLQIKQKLGITDTVESAVSNEEIEAELEQGMAMEK